MKPRFADILIACGALICISRAAAQSSYSIDWYSIDSGGGSSAGGNYDLRGSIGQPDAGTISGGGYTLAGGFWGIVTAIQTGGAPLLTVRYTQTNTVVVAWPSPSVNWQLQYNAQLNTSNWTTAPQVVNDNGASRFIVVDPPIGNRYYRLMKL